jgi:UDP-N-acetylmuramoyl-L-alanyl-D-glutamate--2,6-diaminopimelate ligase
LLKPAGVVVINGDDGFGRRLAAQLPAALVVGTADNAACRVVAAEQTLAGIRADIDVAGAVYPLQSQLVGHFNLSNLICAFAAAQAVGVAPTQAVAALNTAQPAPGRMERIANNRDALILVDYAHTGDALEQVLTTVRALGPKRLITVFGCGGDRDRSKRPVMGEVAGRYSDIVLVTSDNPRTEEPQSILDAIRPGVATHLPYGDVAASGRFFRLIGDRRQAIEAAIALLEAGDALVVAGKGHEDYQILGSQRIPFDDREEIRRALTGENA